MSQWLEWAEITHDMDVLAARDPVSRQQWLADLDEWITRDPQAERGAA